jgi:hypothetical protein
VALLAAVTLKASVRRSTLLDNTPPLETRELKRTPPPIPPGPSVCCVFVLFLLDNMALLWPYYQ